MAHDPLEDYLRELRDIRRSGSAVPETSYYPALAALLDAVGATLKPKVRCIVNPSHGAGIPDVGLFTPDQFPESLGRGTSARDEAVTWRRRGEADQQRRLSNGRWRAGIEILDGVPPGPRHEFPR